MGDEAFLKQAREDAESVRNLPDSAKERLHRETDWAGYRMRGYEFPAGKTATNS